jgi:hypothetical protein
VVQNDKTDAPGNRGDDQVRDRGARCCPRSASSASTATARSSAVGVVYSIGKRPRLAQDLGICQIAKSGGERS